MCKELLPKIDRCDTGAKEMPTAFRKLLERSCPPQLKRCVAIDTSTEKGCEEFMGCLSEPE